MYRFQTAQSPFANSFIMNTLGVPLSNGVSRRAVLRRFNGLPGWIGPIHGGGGMGRPSALPARNFGI